MSDLISRADVLKYPIRLDHYDEVNGSREFVYGVESVMEYVGSLPSADAESDDLIIKGAKGIKDGLYNITDGKLFMYKANGGTVRTYPIVPSANYIIESPNDVIESQNDVIKVVRCKDCKHYIVEGITTQYGWCHEYKHSVDEDDYCSYGERQCNYFGERREK